MATYQELLDRRNRLADKAIELVEQSKNFNPKQMKVLKKQLDEINILIKEINEKMKHG